MSSISKKKSSCPFSSSYDVKPTIPKPGVIVDAALKFGKQIKAVVKSSLVS